MSKNINNQSLDQLTLLDFFAAMSLIGLANSKIPLKRRAALAYGQASEMLVMREEVRDIDAATEADNKT